MEMQRRCKRHGDDERWMICSHLDKIEKARFMPEGTAATATMGGARVSLAIRGEAFCPDCLALVDAGQANRAPLVLACGACVRERWKIEGAS